MVLKMVYIKAKNRMSMASLRKFLVFPVFPGLIHGMQQFLHFRFDALHYLELVILATMIKINEELH